MKGLRAVGAVAVAVVVAVVVAANVDAAPAKVLDKTYSCKVRPQHYVDLAAQVDLLPIQNQPQPAQLSVTTLKKGTRLNGYVPQLSFQATKSGVKVDRAVCRLSSLRVPLKPTGLPKPPQTATPSFLGRVDARCVTAKRLLVHLRITLQNAKPAQALVAFRNDNEQRKPVAFYRWSRSKISGYLGRSCVSSP